VAARGVDGAGDATLATGAGAYREACGVGTREDSAEIVVMNTCVAADRVEGVAVLVGINNTVAAARTGAGTGDTEDIAGLTRFGEAEA